MRHEEAVKRLPDLLDDRDDAGLLAHVRDCADCQRQLFLLGRIDRMLRTNASAQRAAPTRQPTPRQLLAAAAVVVAAAAAGGFHREDAHHSRTAGPLDTKGWKVVSRELASSLKRIEQAFEDSRARLAKDPDAEGVEATVVLMQCEGPKPKSVTGRRSEEKAPGHREANDAPELELDDVLPPGA